MSVDIVGAIMDYNNHQYSPRELVSEYGGDKTGIGKLAAAMIGKSYERGISKDPEYKAARRNVERYLQGTRKPGEAGKEKLNEIGKKKAPIKAPKKITLDGTLAVNGRGDKYERDRTVDIPPSGQSLSDEVWNDLTAYAAEGDAEGCWNTLAQQYHVDELELLEGDIDFS